MNPAGFCYYRLPGSSEIFLIEGELQTFLNKPEASSGFVFVPFESNKKYFISGLPTGVNFPDKSKVLMSRNQPTWQEEPKEMSIRRIEDFKALTELGVLKKIVAARTRWIPETENSNPFDLFVTLCREYPDAFVYLWSANETGTWMGATPEMLFRHQNLQAQTVALAGTRRPAASGSFEMKEIAEQQWVLKFLLETLSARRCTQIETGNMKEIKAGHLHHLVNAVTFRLKDISDRWEIVRVLHPTPAVSGYPQQDSIERILSMEPFRRSFYSGYLGPFGTDNSNFFVNLRCLEYFRNGCILYAGAGITPDSVPEDEWNEMEEKMNTLKRWM